MTLTICRLHYTVRKLVYFAQTWPFATDVLQGRRVQSLPSMRAESDSDSEGIGGSWRMPLMQSSHVMTFKWESKFQLGAFTFCQSMISRVFNVISLNRLFGFVWGCTSLSRCLQFVSCLIVPGFSSFTFTAIQRELANSTLAEFGTVDYEQTPQGREKKRFEAICAQQISTGSVYNCFPTAAAISANLRLWGSLGVSSRKVPWHGQVQRGSEKVPGKVPVLVRGRLREKV